jgi:hypothetical protein
VRSVVTFLLVQSPGFSDGPASDSFDTALDPPAIQHTQARHAVKRSLPGARTRCFEWWPRRVSGADPKQIAVLKGLVLALRDLGTARTAAYFSTAPFIAVVLSLFCYAKYLRFFLGQRFLNALWGMDAFDRVPRERSFT